MRMHLLVLIGCGKILEQPIFPVTPTKVGGGLCCGEILLHRNIWNADTWIPAFAGMALLFPQPVKVCCALCDLECAVS